MKDVVEIDLTQAEALVQELRQVAQQSIAQFRAVDSMIEHMDSHWLEGSGRDFIEQYRILTPEIRRFAEVLTVLADAINASLVRFSELDGQLADRLSTPLA